MTEKEKKARQARQQALSAHLAATDATPDPESLSRSYGLEITEVRRLIKLRNS
ncbi:hypothetical protein [Novosphingopyxis sp. YJ-S2-01]|uniref:hypothetical protein n=1 Tax=Novosphingopyxis sp. YJ-S2-01 TaxID=2794021 RepID=UPI0018DB8204|nr:hypothetical protein [Novosphingopyxis sp. YJ-S2-01]MBH9537505.1 hypothetical protein [Novosphingopyxis sp. YJ-S2-01]